MKSLFGLANGSETVRQRAPHEFFLRSLKASMETIVIRPPIWQEIACRCPSARTTPRRPTQKNVECCNWRQKVPRAPMSSADILLLPPLIFKGQRVTGTFCHFLSRSLANHSGPVRETHSRRKRYSHLISFFSRSSTPCPPFLDLSSFLHAYVRPGVSLVDERTSSFLSCHGYDRNFSSGRG